MAGRAGSYAYLDLRSVTICVWWSGLLSEHLSKSNSEAQAEILKLILEIGVDPDVPAKKHGFRPSHTCASFGHVDLVPVIFACRPQMEAHNCNGDTPLQAAQRDLYRVRGCVFVNFDRNQISTRTCDHILHLFHPIIKEDESYPERKALRPLVAKALLEVSSLCKIQAGLCSIT
jgi:hypothetical protein